MKLHTIAAALILAGSPVVAQTAYEGQWDCDGTLMIFDGTDYYVGRNSAPARISRLITDGADYSFTLSDGSRFSLMQVTENSAWWTSLDTGDTFECRRVSATAPDGTSVAGGDTWVGLFAQGYMEGQVGGGDANAPSIGSTCGNGKAVLGFNWPGNQPQGTVQVSVDGGVFTTYSLSNGGMDANTPGYRALIEAMIAGNRVSFVGSNGEVATLGLRHSSRYLGRCLNP